MTLLGLNTNKPAKPSPLEGPANFRAQHAEADLGQLAKREWWLWLSALAVTALSGVALLLSSFPSLFRHSEHFYEVRSEQARWAILCLMLLFNARMVSRQASFRRLRKKAAEPKAETDDIAGLYDPSGMDPVTGLLTRGSVLNHLGKEIARARKQHTALSLATVHLEDLGDLYKRFGTAAVDQALKEFARRLKEVSRGSDYAVRLGNEDFVLVLPKCNLGEVSEVLRRMGPMELDCAGKKISLAYTTGWVDYQPGDMPSDLLKRASQLLHLYDNAAKEAYSATGTSN
ncbi:MAG TPA: GGDEF domain-containing protein [Candidatus Angelobacter sp.]|nr:GGDEF domain-containing protein [Candidatus Angelobacter sp.]